MQHEMINMNIIPTLFFIVVFCYPFYKQLNDFSFYYDTYKYIILSQPSQRLYIIIYNSK